MSDVTQTETPAKPETTPAANSPEARTDTGEIKDLTQLLPSKTEKVEEKVEPKSASPEAYTFTVPEGYKLDDSLVAEVTPIFKDLNLSQDQAQKLVDLYSKQAMDQTKALQDIVSGLRQEWRDGLAKDTDIGGKLDTVKADIGRMKAAINDPVIIAAFNEGMNLTGAGDHPGIIKGLYKIAEMVNEGKFVSGNGPSPHGQRPNGQDKKPSLAQSMYPNLS